MNLITNIKDALSDVAVTNLAGHLGEDSNGTRLGLDLGVGVFLAGVIKFAANDKTGRGLLGILTDGGHTGDIVNNFETFSGNPEKARLLETIGGNIVNHFLKDKSAMLADKIADHAGIKSSSSSALLHLAAPLVLGFMGKTVREENMSALDLKTCLAGAAGEVSASLPSSLLHALNLPKFNKGKSTPLSHYNAVKALNKDEKRKGENWSMILPWVLLLFVGVLIWYFSRGKEEPSGTPETIQSEVLLPLDTLVAGTSEPAPLLQDTAREMFKSAENLPVVQEEPVVVSAKVEETFPAGFQRVDAAAFAKGSAEIVYPDALASLLSSLKQSRKKLVLSPLRSAGTIATDRAYAIRDYMIENGVEFSRVEITAPVKGNSAGGLAYKISE